jgi:sugar-specific transcriptional regulator TrmB
MDDEDAVEALTRLGLSTYAARTFLGLQKLGTASAGEVAGVVDVPRSQVYGATDELRSLGLVDVQEGSPTRYRPQGVEEARGLLYERLRSDADEAFAYLESVRGECRTDEETGTAIWTAEGEGSITARTVSLVESADRGVTYATGEPELLDGEVLAALTDATEAGLSVTVASAEPEVRELAAKTGVEVLAVTDDSQPGLSIGRLLVADGDTVLVSVLPSAGLPQVSDESAFWSQGTAFARILAQLVTEYFA